MATGTSVINREQIEANLGAVPAALTRLAVDSATDDLPEVLAAAGFDASRRAVFVCEVVMQYLTEDRARATIGHALALALLAACPCPTRDDDFEYDEPFSSEAWDRYIEELDLADPPRALTRDECRFICEAEHLEKTDWGVWVIEECEVEPPAPPDLDGTIACSGYVAEYQCK